MVKIAKLWLLLTCLCFGMPSVGFAQETGSALSRMELHVAEADSSAMPKAQPAPIHHDTERGDIELGLGFGYFRFVSSQFNANTYGLTTNFTYYLRPWMGAEGNISSGWGTQTASSAMAKSVLYAGGVRVIHPHERLVRPWAHALLGGIHMFPQSAFGNNGFAAEVGGGADVRLRSWLWVRMEGNYIRTQLHTQGQNNFQIASSIVYRF